MKQYEDCVKICLQKVQEQMKQCEDCVKVCYQKLQEQMKRFEDCEGLLVEGARTDKTM